MIFEYDAETDMLYIRLTHGTSTESEEITPGIVVDFDEQNCIVGIEIEDASKRADLSRLELRGLPLTNLILGERALA